MKQFAYSIIIVLGLSLYAPTTYATNPPVITLVGDNPETVEVHATYTDPGATASDAEDGDLTNSITTDNTVNTNVSGTYTVTYTVVDSHENNAQEVVRTVVVEEPLDREGSSSKRYECRDPEAINYSWYGYSDPNKCKYKSNEEQRQEEVQKRVQSILVELLRVQIKEVLARLNTNT